MATYQENVSARLDGVHAHAVIDDGRELGDLRLIVFSDLHKGQRDPADDFELCEQTYLGALEYYWQQQFELFLLGDVEELWECWPQPVIDHYTHVLNQEQLFAEITTPGRYVRFVGNHDDLWYNRDAVQRYLQRFLAGHPVIEALRMRVLEQGQELGELFFLHGHQGTVDSDRFARVSAWLIRNFWRPIQRVLNIRSTTPSTNFELRQRHELAMYTYAAGRSGMVLMAGHTHHPVWEGLGFAQAMEESARRGVQMQADPEWKARESAESVRLPGYKPSYFNCGCCSFSDGSITGLEIAEQELRLVRWSAGPQPARAVLFHAPLQEIFRRVAS